MGIKPGYGLGTKSGFSQVRLFNRRGSQVEICWPSLPEQIYQIQYRSPLTTNFWTDLGTTILGTGTQNCVLEDVPAEGPPRFYRVIRVLPAQ